NYASTHGKKKQVAVSSKDVSNLNPFDALNLVENDDDLGMNEGILKSDGKRPNSDVSPSNHGFFNVASSSSTTLIINKIDKLERQIIEWKLTLVDDDGKPLPKVVSKKNADSDSELEEVVDEHVVFMASTCSNLVMIVDMVAGANNDITVLNNSPLFDDLLDDIALVAPFEVNGVTFQQGYYMADKIYPQWSSFVKSFFVAKFKEKCSI
ncbi:ALP1-like protein, partial [Tanacetum coccineum]